MEPTLILVGFQGSSIRHLPGQQKRCDRSQLRCHKLRCQSTEAFPHREGLAMFFGHWSLLYICIYSCWCCCMLYVVCCLLLLVVGCCWCCCMLLLFSGGWGFGIIAVRPWHAVIIETYWDISVVGRWEREDARGETACRTCDESGALMWRWMVYMKSRFLCLKHPKAHSKNLCLMLKELNFHFHPFSGSKLQNQVHFLDQNFKIKVGFHVFPILNKNRRW